MMSISSTPTSNVLPSGPIPHPPPNFYPFHMPSASFRPLPPGMMQPQMTFIGQPIASSSTPPSSTTISLNRSQRCGVCSGCKNKACGVCHYCLDSPQFGGPGVKKQSCIERRCLRVLENRLQRDAPTFKARLGCNTCEDCKIMDCQCCLVCLDKKFFGNRYMPGALCAKKRCNNATNLDITPMQSVKRPCDWSNIDYNMLAKKRNIEMALPPPTVFQPLPTNIPLNNPQFQFISKAADPIDKQLHVLPSLVHHPVPALPHSNLLMPVPQPIVQNGGHHCQSKDFHPTNEPLTSIKELDNEPTNEPYPFSLPSISSLNVDPTFINSFSNDSSLSLVDDNKEELKNHLEPNLDPFLPPSYYETKNRVVLQPL